MQSDIFIFYQNTVCLLLCLCAIMPHACFGVVRIDLLRFLARCHKRRLNQAVSVLSLSIGFFVYILLFIRDTFVLTVVCMYHYVCVDILLLVL